MVEDVWVICSGQSKTNIHTLALCCWLRRAVNTVTCIQRLVYGGAAGRRAEQMPWIRLHAREKEARMHVAVPCAHGARSRRPYGRDRISDAARRVSCGPVPVQRSRGMTPRAQAHILWLAGGLAFPHAEPNVCRGQVKIRTSCVKQSILAWSHGVCLHIYT